MNPPNFDKVEDVADRTHLNEASVVHNLRLRYLSIFQQPHSGLSLVTVNPNKRSPIYTDELVKAYKGRKRNEMAPHIFAISDAAYRDVLWNNEHSTILIIGKSGVGKTENTKKCHPIPRLHSQHERRRQTAGNEQQILQANPILESFGNAQMIWNSDFTRVGYIQSVSSSTLKVRLPETVLIMARNQVVSAKEAVLGVRTGHGLEAVTSRHKGTVVFVLHTRYAGKKAVIVKQFDDATKEFVHAHAVVAGIERYPLKVTKRMGQKRVVCAALSSVFAKVGSGEWLLSARLGDLLELERMWVARMRNEAGHG
ncbi:Myosin-9 [Rhizophlyctis rosea]|nr:Myosin-9 [Rhizophlyctis rosea]